MVQKTILRTTEPMWDVHYLYLINFRSQYNVISEVENFMVAFQVHQLI